MLSETQYPNAWQYTAFGPRGILIHCGARNITRPTLKKIRRIERKWRAWRVAYRLREGIPTDPREHATQIHIHRIGEPAKVTVFYL